MSFEKIKIINPTNVRNPENGYVYLGYGYVSAVSFTGPWIKESDGTVSVISGGTGGGGGGVSYWTNPALGYISPVGSNKLRVGGDTTGTQDLNVAGGIKIGNTSTATSGSIRWTGTDFQGYTGSVWKSFTASGGTSGTAGESYWTANAQGIQYASGKVYVGGSFTVSSNNDIMNIQGGITLQKSTKTNAGTIHYDTTGTVNDAGFYGYHNGWKRLDVFRYNSSNSVAYFPNSVLIGGVESRASEYTSQLKVSGQTGGVITSGSIYNDWNQKYPDNGYSSSPDGGFGGWSGSTTKWGLTGTFVLGAAAGDALYSRYTVDIVNGIIVGFRGKV